MDIKTRSIASLFALHSEILDEMMDRKVIRSFNSPVGDYAEFLFSKTFNWELASGSEKGFDARDAAYHYQIKSRRLTKVKGSRQLNVVRELEAGNFDYLAGILFGKDYSVILAAIIPHSCLLESKPAFNTHQNGHIFHLDDRILMMNGVRDVTDDVKRLAKTI